MENIDIKDFQTVSSVADNDTVLLSQINGTGARMKVALLRSQLQSGIKPSIRDNYWFIGETNTGIKASGQTPEFRNSSMGIEWKYSDETSTAWRLLVEYDVLKLKYSDLTPADKEELKLKLSDLTPTEISELQQPASDMISQLEQTDHTIKQAETVRNQDYQTIRESVLKATNNANDTASHPTYVGADYYVYVWDKETGTYNKSDIFIKGDAFSIAKTYASVAKMEADFSGTDTKEGDFVLIETGDVEDPDNSKVYVKTSTGWKFLTDMSGAIGFTGKTPQLFIGTVVTGDAGSNATVTLSPDGIDTNGNPKFKINYIIPRGYKGDKGDAFTYLDFTTEQLELLKGENGSKWFIAYFQGVEIATNFPIEGSNIGDYAVDAHYASNYVYKQTELHTWTRQKANLKGIQGDKGNPFVYSDFTPEQLEALKGLDGAKGDAATISVGSVTTGDAGSNAEVTNSGTSSEAILNFTIPKGKKGDTGDPFRIVKTYTSVTEMNNDYNNLLIPIGSFVVISGSVESEDTGKLYIKNPTEYEFIVDLSGMRGFTGKTPVFQIGSVASGTTASATTTSGGTDTDGNPIYNLNLILPKGERGLKGDAFTYSDFTTAQLAALKGEPGRDGTNGISADYQWSGTSVRFYGASGWSSYVNLRGATGYSGSDGYTYIPSVSPSGDLSWTKSYGSGSAPATVNIKGADGKQGIQGVPGVVDSATLATLAKTDLSNVTLSKNMSSNGYYKAPDGLMIQWGKASSTPGNQTVYFSTSFYIAPYSIITNTIKASTDLSTAVVKTIVNVNTSYFSILSLQAGSVAGEPWNWIAIGRWK